MTKGEIVRVQRKGVVLWSLGREGRMMEHPGNLRRTGYAITPRPPSVARMMH
jgi:hypothetical protein